MRPESRPMARRGRGVLEAVPNFSEGRDARFTEAVLEAVLAAGADVLDRSSDPDHHRSVVTLVGTTEAVERAAFEAARVAVERIDLRTHQGVHPRIGALDVLPFVPLAGTEMRIATEAAHRVGQRIVSELGVPVYFYGHASQPPGRRLAELRRGGFEALVEGWPADRQPDLLPSDWPHPGAHPTAGAICVGARPVLLAWNVALAGIDRDEAARIAAMIRETGGGFPGLRALAFRLEEQDIVQISMNLEDSTAVSPLEVFKRIEELAAAAGGHVVETEIIGMLPDELLFSAAADRMKLASEAGDRLLSRRLVEHLANPAEHPDPQER